MNLQARILLNNARCERDQALDERNAAWNEIERLRGQLEKSERERDDLAAHVTKLRNMAEEVFKEMESDHNPTCHAIFQAAIAAPATSLAAHDAALLMDLTEHLTAKNNSRYVNHTPAIEIITNRADAIKRGES